MAAATTARDSRATPGEAFRTAQFLAQLETEISIRTEELDALVRARAVLLGTPRGAVVSTHSTNGTAPTTIAEAVEQILTGIESMHISLILEELKNRFGMKTTPKNLINTLNRWVSRKRKFKRPRPNTFALMSASAAADGAGRRRAG